MADAVTQFSTISTDAPNVWIAERMYNLSERRLQVGQWATKHTLPQRMSKTMRVVRYSRLTLPRNTLTEGVPPDSVALAVENVDVTVEQWGIVVLITDVGLITTKHPALSMAIERTSLAISEVLEREMCQVLMAGTNVFYPGAVTARSSIVATDILSTGLVVKATSFLRDGGAGDWEGGLYGGVLPPQAEADLASKDVTFQNASNYMNVKVLQYAEVGVWMGVRWTRGNFLPKFRGVATPDTAAVTTTKVKYTTSTSGGTLATANYQLKIVGRDINSNYERLVSQQTGNVSVTGATGSIAIDTPTSANYTWDIYMTAAGGTTAYLITSNVASSTTYTITTAPAGTEATAPVAPASTVESFVAFIFGKDGFGRVELSGMSLQSYITPPGASYSNPLAQGRKVGCKLMWKSFIMENAFFCRLEFGSGLSGNFPT